MLNSYAKERLSTVETLASDKIKLKEKLKQAIEEIERLRATQSNSKEDDTDDTIVLKLEEEIERLQKRLQISESSIDAKMASILQQCNSKMETEIAQIELKYQKINGELLDTNRELAEKINQVSNILKKTQENSKILHIQFISALNGQKELAEKEIRGRDTYIKQLEEYIKKITEEYTAKLSEAYTRNTAVVSAETPTSS